MRKINVLEYSSLDGVIQAPRARRKIPVAASRMAGGHVHILTLLVQRPQKS
jgi:hypothetical protein